MLTKTPTATFIRHYIEMVVVMFAGMIVLGLPGEAALKAIGSGTSRASRRRSGRCLPRHGRDDDGPDGRVDALPRPPLAADARDGRLDDHPDPRRHRPACRRCPAASAP